MTPRPLRAPRAAILPRVPLPAACVPAVRDAPPERALGRGASGVLAAAAFRSGVFVATAGDGLEASVREQDLGAGRSGTTIVDLAPRNATRAAIGEAAATAPER